MLGVLVPKDLAKLMLNNNNKKIEKDARKIFFPSKSRVMGSEAEQKRLRSSLSTLLWQEFNRITSSGSNSKLPGEGRAGGLARSIAFLKINHSGSRQQSLFK